MQIFYFWNVAICKRVIHHFQGPLFVGRVYCGKCELSEGKLRYMEVGPRFFTCVITLYRPEFPKTVAEVEWKLFLIGRLGRWMVGEVLDHENL